MISFLCSISNRGWAVFITRWILGLLFLVRGWHKVFVMTPSVHTQRFFLDQFADSWIPDVLLQLAGYSIPFLELVGGLLIVAGLKVRETLIVFGLILIVTTYGHALQEPFFDIAGHTFTYLVMIVFLLLAGSGEDRLSVGYFLANRQKSAA